MHVLVFSPTPTSPADQGNRQRVRNVCKALQDRGAKIHFAYFPSEWGGKFSSREHGDMRNEWDYFDTIVPSKPLVRQTDNRYFGIDDWWDEGIGKFVRYKCDGMAFDACIVNYAFFSKAFEYLPPNVIRILDTHDRLSGRREMLERNGVAAEFFYTTEEQELIALDRADAVIAINREEATLFRSVTSKPVITLGHVVKRQLAPTSERRTSAPYRMGFLGSSNSVNVKSLNDFFRAVATKTSEGIPGIEFEIYGRCCPRLVVPPEIAHRVKLRGRIEEVAEFYANVDCVFVPFLFGTGQKIKLIEALSFGKPLIATANASEGSGSTSKSHLLESFDEVMDAMRRFATDKQFREDLEKETAETFANYEATVEKAVDAVFEFASLNSMEANVDRRSVANFFSGKTDAEVVNEVARFLSVLDLLDAVGRLNDKGRTIETLRAGVSDAQMAQGCTTLLSASRGKARIGATQIVFSGLTQESDTSDGDVQLRVHFPGSVDARAPSAAPTADLYVDCRPKARTAKGGENVLARAHMIHTATDAPDRRQFERFEQLLVFCETLDAPELLDPLKVVTTEIKLRTERKLAIVCIDRTGRRGILNRGTLDIENADGDAVETVKRCRAIALGKPSIALAWKFSHSTADALHRILINDSGPIISLLQERAIPIDGEILVRSLREVAVWTAHFLMAPQWGSELALQRRKGASAMDSMNTIAQQLHATIMSVKREPVTARLSALALQETARKVEVDTSLDRLIQAPFTT